SPMPPAHPASTLFPYTTLFRSERRRHHGEVDPVLAADRHQALQQGEIFRKIEVVRDPLERRPCRRRGWRRWLRLRHAWACEGAADRKSTRLNSSHGSISYAVFC